MFAAKSVIQLDRHCQPFQGGHGIQGACGEGSRSTSRSQSHPLSSAIERRAAQESTGANTPFAPCRPPGSTRARTSAECTTAPQRYAACPWSQCRATQAPCRRRDKTIPMGQGCARQHTPQPLQGAPSAGLVGARGSMKMVLWVLAMMNEGMARMVGEFKSGLVHASQ